MTAKDNTDHPIKTFFGRRKGRPITQLKEDLMQTRLAEFEVAFPLPNSTHASLEIGYGSGEHLIELAKQNPDNFYLGTEAYLNGNAAMLRSITENNIGNIRLFPYDANDLFPKLPTGYFNEIFVLYPDPWPKNRHEDRRMISPDRLKIFAKILKPQGRLLVVSDHPVYIPHAIKTAADSGLFEWTAKESGDFTRPPKDWFTTRYEQKALRESRTPIYLEFTLRHPATAGFCAKNK